MINRLLFLFFLNLIAGSALAQEQEQVAKFIVMESQINGEDITEVSLEAGQYVVLYLDEEDFYMANVFPDTQSFGKIFNVEHERFEETEEEYGGNVLLFNWRYINTYDDKKGSAKVKLVTVVKPQGTNFFLEIMPENLDVLVYKGYMEGSLNTSVFR